VTDNSTQTFNSDPQQVFRGMKSTPDRLPLLARSARALGVRVPHDIQPDELGRVHPGAGGMSVAPESPRNLPPHRRPRGFGGTGQDPVFFLSIDALPQTLALRRDKPRHALVEPANMLPLMVYEAALQHTRPDWRRLDDPR
jgi:hypothetical protein